MVTPVHDSAPRAEGLGGVPAGLVQTPSGLCDLVSEWYFPNSVSQYVSIKAKKHKSDHKGFPRPSLNLPPSIWRDPQGPWRTCG